MNSSSEKNSSERTALLRTLKQRFVSTASFSTAEKFDGSGTSFSIVEKRDGRKVKSRAEVRFAGSQEQATMMETIVGAAKNVPPVERQQALEILMALHAINIAGAIPNKITDNKVDLILDSMAKHAKQMINEVDGKIMEREEP